MATDNVSQKNMSPRNVWALVGLFMGILVVFFFTKIFQSFQGVGNPIQLLPLMLLLPHAIAAVGFYLFNYQSYFRHGKHAKEVPVAFAAAVVGSLISIAICFILLMSTFFRKSGQFFLYEQCTLATIYICGGISVGMPFLRSQLNILQKQKVFEFVSLILFSAVVFVGTFLLPELVFSFFADDWFFRIFLVFSLSFVPFLYRKVRERDWGAFDRWFLLAMNGFAMTLFATYFFQLSLSGAGILSIAVATACSTMASGLSEERP